MVLPVLCIAWVESRDITSVAYFHHVDVLSGKELSVGLQLYFLSSEILLNFDIFCGGSFVGQRL